MVSLDDIHGILLEITGDDFTKANILTHDRSQVDTLCQGASIHVRVGEMTRIEIVQHYEEDGESFTKSTWFTVEDASCRIKAWRELEQPDPEMIEKS